MKSSAPSLPSEQTLKNIFKGSKARWLPLYRRLLARLVRLPNVQLAAVRGDQIAILGKKKFGILKATPSGVELGLALAKAAVKSSRLRPSEKTPKWVTHRVLLTEPSEIDEELLTWIKAASQPVRTAIR